MRHGDGTLGWADAAPFDAILVAAGGPEVPEALRNQLKIGGRLIIPIGELGGTQELVKVVRDSEDRYHEEDLGQVTFVPLIGARGWAESTTDAAPAYSRLWPRQPARTPRAPSVTDLLREAAKPLPDVDGPVFGAMFDRFAGARIVLLGEATHGTSEFYARAHRSPAGWSTTDLILSRSKRIGRTRHALIAMCDTSPSMLVAARHSAAFRSGCGAMSRSLILSTGCAHTTLPCIPMSTPASSVSTSTI